MVKSLNEVQRLYASLMSCIEEAQDAQMSDDYPFSYERVDESIVAGKVRLTSKKVWFNIARIDDWAKVVSSLNTYLLTNLFSATNEVQLIDVEYQHSGERLFMKLLPFSNELWGRLLVHHLHDTQLQQLLELNVDSILPQLTDEQLFDLFTNHPQHQKKILEKLSLKVMKVIVNNQDAQALALIVTKLPDEVLKACMKQFIQSNTAGISQIILVLSKERVANFFSDNMLRKSLIIHATTEQLKQVCITPEIIKNLVSFYQYSLSQHSRDINLFRNCLTLYPKILTGEVNERSDYCQYNTKTSFLSLAMQAGDNFFKEVLSHWPSLLVVLTYKPPRMNQPWRQRYNYEINLLLIPIFEHLLSIQNPDVDQMRLCLLIAVFVLNQTLSDVIRQYHANTEQRECWGEALNAKVGQLAEIELIEGIKPILAEFLQEKPPYIAEALTVDKVQQIIHDFSNVNTLVEEPLITNPMLIM